MTEARRSPAVRAALKGYFPTDEQWSAISHPLEPLYLIAGAGSGKTAVMAARIAWALESHGYSPSQVLGLTFTNKAADELQDRVRLALSELHDESGEDVSIFTYNAFAAGVVRDHGLLVNVEPEAGLLTEAQQWQLVLSCLDDLPPFDILEVRSAYVVRWALALAGSVADHMCSLGDIEAAADRILRLEKADEKVLQTAAERKELVRAVAAYSKAKQKAQRIDFGDQITKAVEILEGHAEVRDAFRTRFPFVLLDEYQDTNVAQRRMLQALIGEGGAVTAVGDARQAIFAWRGATMFNLINFPQDFPRADGQPYEPVSLSENFRSGSKILEVANSIVDQIDPARRPGKPLRAQGFNGSGEVELCLFADERAEAAWIAESCDALRGSPTAEGRDPVMWKDIAILVRRKAAMDMILQALEEKQIPVEVVGLGGLLKTPEVMEIVAWLRALETKPGANRWLGRILLGPRWRINYRDLSLLSRWAASQNWDLRVTLAGGDPEGARDMEPGDVGFALAEALGHLDEIENLSPEARRRLIAFAKQLGAIRKRSNAPLLELVQEIIRQAGIIDAIESSSSRTSGAAKQNISNFLDQVAAFAPVEGDASLRSFIAYLDAAEEAEETLDASQPADQDSVKLMTVHAAKGLEFECVFVPSVAASENARGEKVYSLFPNTRASNPLTSRTELPYEVRDDAAQLPRFEGKIKDFQDAVKLRALEDERRLFYVALTRAKQRLAVTASWWYGRDKRPRGPSLFWDELAPLADRGLLSIPRRDDPPEENPLFDALEDRRVWPPIPRAAESDPLFPDGWGAAADRLVDGEVDWTAFVDAGQRDTTQGLLEEHARDLDLIARAVSEPPARRSDGPEIVPATSLVRLASSGGGGDRPQLDRALPQRPTLERRIGTEVHRLIEEKARGVSPYPDEDELDEPDQVPDPGVIQEYIERFEASGYAERELALLPSGEPMVELPFTMAYEDKLVRGRIDAVYTDPSGGVEIVDFKTGSRAAYQELPEVDQLALYARALKSNGLVSEGSPVRLTYLFLDGEPPLSRELVV